MEVSDNRSEREAPQHVESVAWEDRSLRSGKKEGEDMFDARTWFATENFRKA